MRSIEFIQDLICSIGSGESSLISIRIQSEHSNFVVSVRLTFDNFNLDKNVLKILRRSGLFVDDLVQIKTGTELQNINSQEIFLHEINDPIEELIIFFSREERVLSQSLLMENLKNHTSLGLNGSLQQQIYASKIKFFYGVSQTPLNLNVENLGKVSLYKSYPYILNTLESGDNKIIKFVYLANNGELKEKKVNIDNYLDIEVKQKLFRYNFKPKISLSFHSLIPEDYFTSLIPLVDLIDLRNKINDLTKDSITDFLSNQVRSLEERIEGLHFRRKVYYQNSYVGLEPENEVETVLLLERITSLSSNTLPNGIRIRILDYSPRGIDAICDYSSSSSEPQMRIPVEFEYSLKNFFDHGHDPCQTKLIICYEAETIQFPYDHHGVVFEMDFSHSIPKLISRHENVYVNCLILKDIIELK